MFRFVFSGISIVFGLFGNVSNIGFVVFGDFYVLMFSKVLNFEKIMGDGLGSDFDYFCKFFGDGGGNGVSKIKLFIVKFENISVLFFSGGGIVSSVFLVVSGVVVLV